MSSVRAARPAVREPLLRTLIGAALRTERLGQDRTLRNVSAAAQVSLGYLSEIERGQKEASSELLAAICDALHIRLSEVLQLVLTSTPAPHVRIVEPLPVRHPERVDAPVVNRAA